MRRRSAWATRSPASRAGTTSSACASPIRPNRACRPARRRWWCRMLKRRRNGRRQRPPRARRLRAALDRRARTRHRPLPRRRRRSGRAQHRAHRIHRSAPVFRPAGTSGARMTSSTRAVATNDADNREQGRRGAGEESGPGARSSPCCGSAELALGGPRRARCARKQRRPCGASAQHAACARRASAWDRRAPARPSGSPAPRAHATSTTSTTSTSPSPHLPIALFCALLFTAIPALALDAPQVDLHAAPAQVAVGDPVTVTVTFRWAEGLAGGG